LAVTTANLPGSHRQQFIVARLNVSASALKDLSKAEWKVMRIVWQQGKSMAREIYTVASEEWSWTPATVKTILKRLVDKGYVSTTQVGNGFVYRPAQSALATLQSAADALLINAVDGATGPLLVHMVEQVTLSEDDLDSLQKLIDAKKQSLKQSVKKPANTPARRKRR
jgi:BlaI family penicillinase repressor